MAELNKKTSEVFDEIVGKLSKQYLEKSFDLTKKIEKRLNGELKIWRKIYIIVMKFESNEVVKELESFKAIETVFSQQCKVV